MVKVLLTLVALFAVSFAVATVVRGQTTTPMTTTNPTATMAPTHTPTPSVVVPSGAPATGFAPY